MIRAQDTALYLSWVNAYQTQNLAPNFAAPWKNEPAFFNGFMWLLAKFCKWTGLEIPVGRLLFHFLFYVLAAYALFFAVRVFTESASEFWAAFLVIICSVPLPSLAVLPAMITGKISPLVGAGYFVWFSSDGFFHGIGGSILVTFGTATTLLAFSLLAKYIKTEQRKFLVYSALVAFLSALVHATEIFLIAGAGSLALLWWRGREWRKAVPEIGAFALAGFLGLAPYVLMALRYEWFRDLAQQSRWQLPHSPVEVFLSLGLPAMLMLALLVIRPRMTTYTDRLLQCWVVVALIGIYLPIMPSPQHLLDGFYYAAAILLVRQLTTNYLHIRAYKIAPGLITAAVGGICLLSVTAYGSYYRQSYRDGRAVRPERLFSAVMSQDEVEVKQWMRQNAKSDQLVLAPAEHSLALLSVPMHSFAGHWHWSLTYNKQAELAERFFNGSLGSVSANQMLANYGIRYVVVPKDSPAIAYLGDYTRRITLGSLTIYESAANAMKPYQQRNINPSQKLEAALNSTGY